MSRSSSSMLTPCPMRQSRSISPSLSPPSRARPSVGWRVSTARGPRDPAVHFVHHHVLQLLVVDGSEEYECGQRFAGYPGRQNLFSVVVVSFAHQCLSHLLHCRARRMPSRMRTGHPQHRLSPATSSFSFPTVIREGNPCGFMIMSGTIPFAANGMSSCGTIQSDHPFLSVNDCLNLSPTSGRRIWRSKSLIRNDSSVFDVIRTFSTTLGSVPRYGMGTSLNSTFSALNF